MSGTCAFLLDNLLPATSVERGLDSWRRQLGRATVKFADETEEVTTDLYGLPQFRKVKQRWWFKYVPFFPSFDEELMNWQNIKHKI